MKRTDFSKGLFYISFIESLKMLSPKLQYGNPILFIVYVCAVISTCCLFLGNYSFFEGMIIFWLWLTVLFANFAQTLAKCRGKIQGDSLRRTQTQSYGRIIKEGKEIRVHANDISKGDILICSSGEIIPADGEIIAGIASVDESPITGESAPVIREGGADRSAVTTGTKIVSGQLRILVTSDAGKSFLNRMIGLIEGTTRVKTPMEIALGVFLSIVGIMYILTIVTLKLFRDYTNFGNGLDDNHLDTLSVYMALLVCLLPTTISALSNAISLAGMERLIRRNVVGKSGRSIEAAGDVDLLILDKTGTITLGNRVAIEFLPSAEITEKEFAVIAQLASIADETPEGRSIVVLAKKEFELRAETLLGQNSKLIPFSNKARLSGIDFLDRKGNIIRSIRKGATDAIKHHLESLGGEYPRHFLPALEQISKKGGSPLLVSDDKRIVGIIHLKDSVKGGIKERFSEMRKMGIRTLMVTGDNPLTAAAVAAEAGIDDFIAEATPEIKLERIRLEQRNGHRVAMTGDGTNDAPALAQADVGVAMNTGTQASREAGNMVDLDSNPTKLIEIVEIGKQLLMTRGSITVFSFTNDVARYFAILPALFWNVSSTPGEAAGPLWAMNILHLHSPHSAVISALIYNAFIILALLPLALRGVSYKPQTAYSLFKKNVIYYVFGGIAAPFIGIKLIDMLLTLVIKL